MATVQEIVTQRIIEKMESAESWEQGWILPDIPRNYVTNKPYSGINLILLGFGSPYSSPYWMTYKQAQQQGGNVRKGEKSSIAVFWKPGDSIIEEDDDGKKAIRKRPPVMRYYHVFNWEQTENVPEKAAVPKIHHDPIRACEIFFENLAVAPMTVVDNTRGPCYIPATDRIHLPDRTYFKQIERYYKSRMHETVHWTGHSSRLDRPILEKRAFEELVAELGAAFFAAMTGIQAVTEENSAAYVRSWLEELRNDPKFIIQAAAQAQKAVDYVTGSGRVQAALQAAGVV